MPNTYTELRKTTVGTATGTVTLDLTGISGYTDLVLVMNGSLTGTGAVYCEFNGDTGSNYSSTYMQGQSGSASSGRDTRLFLFGLLTNGSGPNTGIANFQNYANATTFKTVLSRANDTSTVNANVGLWRNTAAITSIVLKTSANNFAVGTTFSLYGITTAPALVTKATGGTIYNGADGYVYHKFTSSGTFTPTSALTADILVVAGGGSGYVGGGGAGGVIGFTAQALTTTGYSITVGAGGAGGVNSSSAGNNSVFAGLTAAVAGGRGGPNDFNASTYSAGGSGGGGGGSGSITTTGGNGTSGQGFNGGNNGGFIGSPYGGGGGGGAGEAGRNATAANAPGRGGNGTDSYAIWASATSSGDRGYFAGGGGSAGTDGSGANGAGGLGGGAAGTAGANNPGATANTGGGGGGVNSGTYSTGNGGSGIVIVRYLG